ncbi:hypothetical protein GLYMA_14G166150v4 [Glycine max]|nr:hypothetical protein GLYMA_14G166150v4 [Glycine max]KAH1094912.1 hypothetical protein GYH30_040281 [Glycine max]
MRLKSILWEVQIACALGHTLACNGCCRAIDFAGLKLVMS